MFAQTLEGTWAYNGTGSIKILLQNRKITAYASITDYGCVIPYNGHHPPYLRNGTVGVSRLVSNGQSEDFDPPVQYIARSKVTEVPVQCFLE